MELKYKLSFALLLALPSMVCASAAPGTEWIVSLRTLAFALGWLCMVIMGLKWIIADSPNERAEAKKSMIYIVVGLLIVASACDLLALYCDTVSANVGGGFTCDTSGFGC